MMIREMFRTYPLYLMASLMVKWSSNYVPNFSYKHLLVLKSFYLNSIYQNTCVLLLVLNIIFIKLIHAIIACRCSLSTFLLYSLPLDAFTTIHSLSYCSWHLNYFKFEVTLDYAAMNMLVCASPCSCAGGSRGLG